MIAAFGARGASERTGRVRAVDGRVETEPLFLEPNISSLERR